MRCAKRRITNHPVVPVGWHASFNGRALVNAMPHVSQRFVLKTLPLSVAYFAAAIAAPREQTHVRLGAIYYVPRDEFHGNCPLVPVLPLSKSAT